MANPAKKNALWLNEGLISDIDEILTRRPYEGIQKIAVHGNDAIAKREIVDYVLKKTDDPDTLSYEFDFSFEKYSPRQLLIALLGNFPENEPKFDEFLNTFTDAQRNFIFQKLSLLFEIETESLQWYVDLLLEFINWLTSKGRFILVFENIDQLDGYQFEKLTEILEEFQSIQGILIFTIDSEIGTKGPLHAQHNLYLSKLYIQTVESAIQSQLRTSVLNARLITNHCYLKSGGIPYKLKLLLYVLYETLIPMKKKEHLDVQKLHRIKIPDSLEELYQLLYNKQNKSVVPILGFLAYLDEPISLHDFKMIMNHFKVPNRILSEWLRSGILSEVIIRNTVFYIITSISLKKWLRNAINLKDITTVIKYGGKSSVKENFHHIYLLSDLTLDTGDAERSITLALKEADYYFSLANFEKAADRYYFAVRISELEQRDLKDLDEILRKLGNIYLYLGNFENAFEIFKRLRNRITRPENIKQEEQKKNWVSVNLKMAEALIQMDAYQEARYLITETKIKKFLTPATQAKCSELLGDIESSIGHLDLATQLFRESADLYINLGEIRKFNALFSRVKNYITRNKDDFSEKILDNIVFPRQNKLSMEAVSPLYLEKIAHIIRQKKFDDALKACYNLKNLLREIYLPKTETQLAFYFGEIYAYMGKWHLALSHLNAAGQKYFVIHRPELHVQVLLQIGLIYKEQAIYGHSSNIFEKAMEICFKNGLSVQLNEIKLHLGHIYLLVHSLMRAYDYLNEVSDWAGKYQKYPIKFLANLYLAFYEIQQHRLEKSRQLLKDAKYILNLSMNPLDYFNYLFYLSFWLITARRFDHAEVVIKQLQNKSKEYARYQAVSLYLAGKLHFARAEFSLAQTAYEKAVRISKKWQYPHLLYLSLSELARKSMVDKDEKARLKAVKNACQQIETMTREMGDEILGRQFLESKFHEDLISFCKEHNLLANNRGNDD